MSPRASQMEGVPSKPAPYLLGGRSEVGGSACVPEVLYRVGFYDDHLDTARHLVRLPGMNLVEEG